MKDWLSDSQHYTKNSSAKRMLTNAQITPTMTGDEETDKKICKSMWKKKVWKYMMWFHKKIPFVKGCVTAIKI